MRFFELASPGFRGEASLRDAGDAATGMTTACACPNPTRVTFCAKVTGVGFGRK